jgi:hypothetical protein
MNKPDKNFKLSKTAKKLAATFIDPHERGAYLRSMVQAELESKKPPPKHEKGSKKDNPTD